MNDYDYYDGQTGEGVTEHELLERYRDTLDQVYEPIRFGELEYLPSRVLESVDPIAFRMGLLDEIDYLTQDGQLTEEPPTA